MMDKNDKSLLSSFRRAFRPSSTRREKTHSTKRKDHRSGGGVVFPEDNAESRYEDMSNFTLQQYDRSKQKSGRKAMHTFSESRKDRPIPPPIRSPIPLRGLPATAHGGQSPANNTATRMIKSSTLPGKRPSRHPPPSPPGPTAHTVRIPPPRHSKRTRLPLPSPTDHLSHYSSTNQIQFMYHSPEHHTPAPSLLPAAPYIPSHAMSTIDMTNGSSATTQLVQRKTAVNISRTGPSTLPHDYCEPFAWLQPHQQQQQQTTTYCTISPPAHNVDQHKSSWIDMDHVEKDKKSRFQVSASMIDLRSEDSDYMEISSFTRNHHAVASDYQQPIALRRLPGPPSAVKERQQRREERRHVRGTIVVMDEINTLMV